MDSYPFSSDMKRKPEKELKRFILDAARGIKLENSQSLLRDLGFSPDEAAAEHFSRVIKRLGINESSLDDFCVVITRFAQAPQPDTALLNLLRYLDTTRSYGTFLDTLARGRPILDILSTTFGSSQYMADIIIRSPGLLYWLIEKNVWESEETLEDHLIAIADETSRFESIKSQLDALKRYHRKILLKIGVHDLMGDSSVDRTSEKLSGLAEAIVRAALEIEWKDALDKPFGKSPAAPEIPTGVPFTPASCGFAVIAMGKLGGCELNYSSDIDLIYLCGNVDDAGIAFYRGLAEKLTGALSEMTDEGYLYRVDLRLRPDGAVGPLVNSFEGMRIYYETRGKPWEFQAFLKARVIAGDSELGGRFLNFISGLIFNPSLPYSPVDDISLLRAQIQENISPRERSANIKLMEGGIRDIEFIVQTVQLLHGSSLKDIRCTKTIETIQKLLENKLIKKWELEALTGAYNFFRLVEHRLQMMHQIKTHTLPESTRDIANLAARVSQGPLGTFALREFIEALTSHLNKIRTLGDRFFSRDTLRETSLLLVLPDSDARAVSILAEYGLTDARQALSLIRSLAYGSYPRLFDRRTRSAFDELLPLLLKEASRTGNPIRALAGIAEISQASGNEYAFYRFMRDEEYMRRLLLRLAGVSSIMSLNLSANPDLIYNLLDDPDGFLESSVKTIRSISFEPLGTVRQNGGSAPFLNLLRREKTRIELGALAVDLKNKIFPATLVRAVSDFASVTISRAFNSFSCKDDAALFVMGSFCVGEPRLRSDIDLLVVSKANLESAGRERLIKTVQNLNESITEANIFKLDFRLRGEGANAPLVHDLLFYKKYFQERIAPWERIAFSKCRFLAGSRDLGGEFEKELSKTLSAPFSLDETAALIQTRQKLVQMVKPSAELWDTKRAKGGRYDIEYMCGLGAPASKKSVDLSATTPERLQTIAAAASITEEECSKCIEALKLYSLIDILMELQNFSIPNTAEKHAFMAKYISRTLDLAGVDPIENIEETLRETKQCVRGVYDKFTNRII